MKYVKVDKLDTTENVCCTCSVEPEWTFAQRVEGVLFLMRKTLVSTIVVAMFLFIWALGGTANAQSLPTAQPHVVTTTKTIPVAPSICAAIHKQHPQLVPIHHGCVVVIVSQTWAQVNAVRANAIRPYSACASGQQTHELTYWAPGDIYHASLFSTFSYDGACDNPTVTYQNCTRDMGYVWPASEPTMRSCDKGISGLNTFTEGNWDDASSIAGGSFWVQTVANVYSMNLSDSWGTGQYPWRCC